MWFQSGIVIRYLCITNYNQCDNMKKKEISALKAVQVSKNASLGSGMKSSHQVETKDGVQGDIVCKNCLEYEQILMNIGRDISKVHPELSELNIHDMLHGVLESTIYSSELCQKMSDQNRTIAQILVSNPRLYIFIEELLKETPIRVALVKSDLVNVAPLEDEDDYDSYNLAVAQSRERRQTLKMKAQQRLDKCEECGEVAHKFYEDNEIEEEEVSKFVEFLDKVIESVFDAEIDRELIEAMWKAYSFEKEVKQARQQGVVDGKNEVIAVRRHSNSDGLPSSSSGGVMRDEAKYEGYIQKLLSRKFQ